MSRVRSKDTKPEMAIRKAAFARGLRYRKHASWLPGKPDLVFTKAKVVVFIDGDFWHGWRFPEWRHTLPSEYWVKKIERNRERDQENYRRLRRKGWSVIRIWEHEVKTDLDACVDRIEKIVRESSFKSP